ncbi:hypothetical protein GXP67_27935 [Rhodocytophaga rosea]|uniref:Phytanoyl-CoA dioxygenase family protein n=1 Tax=Rhodocytophaga rosea TaxID=2704465 RepID=A0A6C0GRI0_9BACT|nr:phytanoyl-CoA dioxygenase family protein [Rhodocytophaga rosea]QHT70203.1 hypothetical protein GXP67_27935 [Rhodocytophaga rosea]
MNTLYFDSAMEDNARRQLLYNGQLFIYSPSKSALALCEFARELIYDHFGNVNPTVAQYHIPTEKYTEILSELKPKFINHPHSRHLVQNILKELGCDLNKTYFDLPRMRTSTSDQYLTTGLAYSFQAHRDTWFSAPLSQLNWWIPIFDIEPENCLAFHPNYWDNPIKNSSVGYSCHEWYAEGRRIASLKLKDTRKRPEPLESIDTSQQIRVICKVGGIILFSGAQMHSTVPNTSGKTRWSIDFRTVHIDDVVTQNGAPNIDNYCTGTLLGDFMRASDLAFIPDKLIHRYEKGTPVINKSKPVNLFA